MTRPLATFSALSAALIWLFGSALGATEFGATHVVLEKATKMKKVEISLLMSFRDQSVRGDQAGQGRRLRCSVAALAKGGALPARGNVRLRLEGVGAGSAPWRGSALSEPLDAVGDALFDAEALRALVDDALASDADPELIRIDFDGGKGKKVSQLTLDCVHELTGEAA